MSYGLIGVILGIALASWLQRRRGTQKASNLRNIMEITLIACAAGIAAFSAEFGVHYLQAYYRTDSYLNRSMDEVRKVPLVRRLLADVPGAEQTLRDALKQDRAAGNSDASFKAIANIRDRYGIPALRAADDQTILATWSANAEVIRWLSANDVSQCAEFITKGLKEPHKLGPDFMVHFTKLLSATEAAYDSGRGRPARETVSDDVLGKILVDDLEMSDEDILAVIEPEKALPRKICDIGLLWSDLSRIPAGSRVPSGVWWTFERVA